MKLPPNIIIIWRQFHLLWLLESSFALNQGLLRSNLRLLLLPLHSCRDVGVVPPEGTKQEDDHDANHPDDHQEGNVLLFELCPCNIYIFLLFYRTSLNISICFHMSTCCLTFDTGTIMKSMPEMQAKPESRVPFNFFEKQIFPALMALDCLSYCQRQLSALNYKCQQKWNEKVVIFNQFNKIFEKGWLMVPIPWWFFSFFSSIWDIVYWPVICSNGTRLFR